MSSQASALQAAVNGNAQARALIQKYGVEMKQSIFSQTFVPANGNVINVIPRNVGLIKYFMVKVSATVTNTSAAALALTDLGPANMLSQIAFTDLQNNVRIQTAGWHMDFINSVKSRRPFATALVNGTGLASPVNYGNNFAVMTAPATIATSATGTVEMWYIIPLAYSDTDYRGAVYANVVNATMQLQLTVNPQNTAFVATGADSTLAVYSGNAAASFTSVSLNVYQVYMDQIPQGQNGAILPVLDLGTSYELKNTTFSGGIVPTQDFTMQYSNFRTFMSTFSIYFNGTNRGTGSDINYWELLAANFTPIWKIEPHLVALMTRQVLGCDLPAGCYYHSSRLKPIITTQYGNMQLVLNPITAGASAYVLTGYEDFAQLNTVTQAGSLANS